MQKNLKVFKKSIENNNGVRSIEDEYITEVAFLHRKVPNGFQKITK